MRTQFRLKNLDINAVYSISLPTQQPIAINNKGNLHGLSHSVQVVGAS